MPLPEIILFQCDFLKLFICNKKTISRSNLIIICLDFAFITDNRHFSSTTLRINLHGFIKKQVVRGDLSFESFSANSHELGNSCFDPSSICVILCYNGLFWSLFTNPRSFLITSDAGTVRLLSFLNITDKSISI